MQEEGDEVGAGADFQQLAVAFGSDLYGVEEAVERFLQVTLPFLVFFLPFDPELGQVIKERLLCFASR